MRTITLGKTLRVVPNTTKRLSANLEDITLKSGARKYRISPPTLFYGGCDVSQG